jgi:DNA-binding MarR family transcriptional regulator
MKRSCGKGRDEDVSSERRLTIAVLLGAFLLSLGTLSISPFAVGGDEPPQGLNDIFWTKGLPIQITGQDFIVNPGQTLYIEAGVTVLVDDNLGIDVRGRIIANGTSAEPILITTKLASMDRLWRSLAFIADEGSVLKHVSILMARNGLHISSSSPRFVNSEISALRSAVVADSRSGSDSYPVFENCSIYSGMSYFVFDVSGSSWVTALNASYNSTKVKVGDPTAGIERQWFLDVHVDNSLGEDVDAADVLLEDNANGTASDSVLTNSDGVSHHIATEYVDRFGFFGENRTYYTPHVIRASKLGYSDASVGQMWIDTNRNAYLTLADMVTPVTSLVISGPTYGTAPTYIGGATQLSFEVAPGGTQPVQTMYSIDGGVWTLSDHTPFYITKEGTNTITFYSFDPAGNVEPTNSEALSLDTTAPTVSVTMDPDGDGSDPVTIDSETSLELLATDYGSGVKSLRYSTNGGFFRDYLGKIAFSEEKHYNISYLVQDNMGNTASGNQWFRIAYPAPIVVNNPPYFIRSPTDHGKVGEDYLYFAEAYDPDEEDVLTYSLINAPVGMAIDQHTGMVTWSPTEVQEGQNLIFIYVTDGKDGDVQIFYIRVQEMDPEPVDNTLLILGAMGAVAITLGAFTGFTEYGRFRFFLYFLVPLYSKLNKEKVLNQFLRGQIYGYIMAYPGENYSSIKKAMGVENGTLTHHLYILEREGFVTSRVDGRNKRFYPSGVTREKKTKASMIQKAILKMIRQSPKLTQTEIAEALGTSKQVVNYHIKSLQKVGLLSVAKNGSHLEYEDLSKKV